MARSPVWKRGCMLMPCVVTYTVPPPSPMGQRSQTAVSTSAARALTLTALRAAFMGKAPGPGRAERCRSRSALAEEVLLDHRQTDTVEGREGRLVGGEALQHHRAR